MKQETKRIKKLGFCEVTNKIAQCLVRFIKKVRYKAPKKIYIRNKKIYITSDAEEPKKITEYYNLFQKIKNQDEMYKFLGKRTYLNKKEKRENLNSLIAIK